MNGNHSNKTKTTKAELSKITENSDSNTDTGHFHSCNHQKRLTYQILVGKPVKNVTIFQQTTKIWPINLAE